MASLASDDDPELFSFSSAWEVLGPFQIGTREATWGADPLEYAGGFRNLTYDSNSTIRSSLPANGSATWNVTRAVQTSTTKTSASISLSVSFSNVDWKFLKQIYGWSAYQYQAWARGEIIVASNTTQHVILHTDAVLEYWVDDTHHFGGDYYSLRRAPPVLHLTPGIHKLDLRLVRDVRAFGGILEPTIDIVLDVRQVSGTLEPSKPGLFLSDVVDGKLASSVGSAYLRNSGEHDIEITGIQQIDETPYVFPGSDRELPQPFIIQRADQDQIGQISVPPWRSHRNSSIVIVAGQTRPIAYNVSLSEANRTSVTYRFTYKVINSSKYSSLEISHNLTHVSKHAPHKITFMHPGGMASYAMLRAPAKNAASRTSKNLPVLLFLHGAGVEAADSTAALDAVSGLGAWILFPTGVTPWSGDDWHNWGFADVEAAVKAIPSWIESTGWTGPGVDINRWVVAGHSNGGQGTWYALTHRPDKIVAAAPVSGYASIQKYVPYEFWQPADPRRIAVVSASLNSYRHEMLMSNTRGIPIQQQHGEVDDNVPAYHSRFLGQQLYLAGADSSYNEVPGQNHWWDTIMTTADLLDFYHAQTQSEVVLPRKLQNFSIVVADPGDMGSKGGITVTRLVEPGQYGRVTVHGRTIRTSNVDSLDFSPSLWSTSISLNGQEVDLTASASNSADQITVNVSKGGNIQPHEAADSPVLRQRYQMGSMTAILRSQGPFVIRHAGCDDTSRVALQISRNLHQYFQADSIVAASEEYEIPVNSTGNVITLVIGVSDVAQSPNFFSVTSRGVEVKNHLSEAQYFGDRARSAVYLRPVPGQWHRLELVLWGADTAGLQQAARLVPMLTGVGQPDFVVLSESARWRGVEGALAMGFFDANWKVTASSIVESG
ncbi:hypothetical protein ACN47E_007009 [Coniothyrium glycines]